MQFGERRWIAKVQESCVRLKGVGCCVSIHKAWLSGVFRGSRRRGAGRTLRTIPGKTGVFWGHVFGREKLVETKIRPVELFGKQELAQLPGFVVTVPINANKIL